MGQPAMWWRQNECSGRFWHFPASPRAVRHILAVQHREALFFHKEDMSGNQFHDIPLRVKDTSAVMCRSG